MAFAGAAYPEIAYPLRPVRVIVPEAPGGTVDLLTRALAERTEATLGIPVVVDDRPGANESSATSSPSELHPTLLHDHGLSEILARLLRKHVGREDVSPAPTEPPTMKRIDRVGYAWPEAPTRDRMNRPSEVGSRR